MKYAILRRIGALIVAAMLVGSLTSCKQGKQEESEESTYDRVSYENLVLSEHIRPLAYTEQTVTLKSADASRADAIWEELLSRAEIITYPQEAIDYYLAQRKSVYRHYAEQNDLSYEEVLEANEITESDLLAEAKEIVKGDLLYRFVVEDANITLTDTEKQTLFDRYVKKYAEQYGYTEEYIKENMEDLVYDSMLYDKVREYLMLHNEFIIHP